MLIGIEFCQMLYVHLLSDHMVFFFTLLKVYILLIECILILLSWDKPYMGIIYYLFYILLGLMS